MRSVHFFVVSSAVFLSLIPCGKAQADKQGCKDSPLISRFPGSVITDCVDKDDDQGTFPMGPGKPDKKIEGEYHWLNYDFPKTASKAQVLRNLHTAVKAAGYIFDYDSGDYGDFTVHLGKTWILIEVSKSSWYRQTIVKETTLMQDVVATAAGLTSGLTSNGHAVVGGILFDTGKADVKPESAAALQEVVKVLQQDGKLKVYVVGHTDNVGALAANIELSRQRAVAVVKELTSKYGIAADRLAAYGDGPYAPVTSNDSEDGRTSNRRVELVKQ